MIYTLAKTVLWIATIAVLAVTILPTLRIHHWWVRMWDFPRLHILVTAIVIAALAVAILKIHALPLISILLACVVYQGIKVWPYSPLAAIEIRTVQHPSGPEFSLLSSNVLMENKEHTKLIDLITHNKPDVLFLMETDEVWLEAMEDVLKDYPTVPSDPRDNHYGLIFATRLHFEKVETVFLVDDETPTLLAHLRDSAGQGFHFIGMHPRPPVPGVDTDERDAQIARAATLTQKSGLPVIAMGDFNDVAWSWTARMFKNQGNFRDPRIGRGPLASFDANHLLMRFPIDQFYLTRGIDLVSFQREAHIGSDHFPMSAVVAINPDESG